MNKSLKVSLANEKESCQENISQCIIMTFGYPEDEFITEKKQILDSFTHNAIHLFCLALSAFGISKPHQVHCLRIYKE